MSDHKKLWWSFLKTKTKKEEEEEEMIKSHRDCIWVAKDYRPVSRRNDVCHLLWKSLSPSQLLFAKADFKQHRLDQRHSTWLISSALIIGISTIATTNYFFLLFLLHRFLKTLTTPKVKKRRQYFQHANSCWLWGHLNNNRNKALHLLLQLRSVHYKKISFSHD